MPEKVDPSKVEPAIQLLQQLCSPASSPFRPTTVADAVIADDQYLRRWPPFEHPRQGSHEHMKAAIGFEIAGTVGDDLVRPRQAAAAAQPKARRRVRSHQI